MENTTPVSTMTLLLVLENIENNVELNRKPSSTGKAKGPEGKRKMELMDSHIPKKPKKVTWSEKHCVLCKKHGGPHKSHNTCACHRFNKDGTPIKKNGGAGKPHFKERKEEGINFAQIIKMEVKKVLCKKAQEQKHATSTIRKAMTTPTQVLEVAGQIAMGNYICVRKLN